MSLEQAPGMTSPVEASTPPSLPFSIYGLARSRMGIKINIQDSLPQEVPEAFLKRYGTKVQEAKHKIYDTWKVNTQIRPRKGKFGRTVLDLAVRPSTYAAWYQLGKTDMNPELRNIVRHAGTSINWLTKDNMLMFQFRSDQNGSYRRWIGAGASGSLDGNVTNNPTQEIDWSINGVRLKKINGTTFKDNVLRESKEETGHSVNRFNPLGRSRVKLIGVFQTSQKPVDEFAYVGLTRKTSEKITDGQTSALARHGDTQENPMDTIGFIEASPLAVEKLLTQVNTPLMPTALGAMLLTGYYLTLKESYKRQPFLTRKRKNAQKEALDWLERISTQAALHYADLSETAKEYNMMANETREEGQLERLAGVDPFVTPEDQGLLSIEEGLQQAGLYYRRDGKTFGERHYTKPKRGLFF